MAEGEGSLGKLLTTDEAHESLVSTLDSIETGVQDLSTTFGKINRIEIDVAAQGWYLDEPEEYHTSLGLDIRPSDKRFYRLGVVSDPAGETEEMSIGCGIIITRR